MSGEIQMRLIGPFALETADGTDLTPKSKRARALLAMLALAPNATRTRKWLQDKLWSDRPAEQGAASLRQELSGMRRHFREAQLDLLAIDREIIRLRAEQLSVDAHDPPAYASSEDLLEGIDVRDPEFEDWLRLERNRLRQTVAEGNPDTLPAEARVQAGAEAHRDTPIQPNQPAKPGIITPKTSRPYIVLGGFAPIGDSERSTLFARGLSDELLTVLGNLSGAFVTKVSDFREQYAAGYTLSGHVRDAERLRITAQLFAIETGACVWTGRFDYDGNASFNAQEEIARKVVEAAQIELRDGEWARIWADSTTSLPAWEAFQRGRIFEAEVRKDSLERARAQYEEVLSLDPDFVPAMISLAFCHVDEIRLSWATAPKSSEAEAQSLYRKALAAAPDNLYARALGAYLHCIAGRHNESCDAMEKVVREAPESPEMTAYYGVLRSYNCEFDLAARLFEHALTLTPHPQNWIRTNLGLTYMIVGENEHARRHLDAALAHDPDNVRAHVGMVVIALRSEGAVSARNWADRLREIEPEFVADRWRSKACFREPGFHAQISRELSAAGL